jgi:ribosomal RNA-processing protein 8
VIYRWIHSEEKKYRKVRNEDPKKNEKQLVVADFGCGAEATLAQRLLSVKSELKKKRKREKEAWCPFKVHSFDLVANGNSLITPCDMAHVPLQDGSVDIVVFVLALMGTNIADFIREAHRVLTPDGILKIAEVRSRFETAKETEGDNVSSKSKGNKRETKNHDASLLDEFLNVMGQLGFSCTKTDRKNKMFFVLQFEKNGSKPSRKASFTAKPCIYKRR